MRRLWILGIILFAPVQASVAENYFYFGAGGALTKLNTDNFAGAVLSGDLGPNDTASSGDFKDDTFGWQVFAGYMFTENFGVVVKYSDSGDAKDDWNGFIEVDDDGDSTTPPIRTDYDFTGEASIDGWTIYAVQTVPLPRNFEFSLELGWTTQDLDFQWDATDISGTVSNDDSGFALGAVLRYVFLEHWAVSAEFEYLNIGFQGLMDEPIKLGLNAEFRF